MKQAIAIFALIMASEVKMLPSGITEEQCQSMRSFCAKHPDDFYKVWECFYVKCDGTGWLNACPSTNGNTAVPTECLPQQ